MTDALITKTESMPMEEFLRRGAESPFELIDGEIIPKMPQVFGHSLTSKRIFLALLPQEQNGLGEVFTETTFVLTDNPRWVRGSRIPDVMFILKATLEAFKNIIPEPALKPLILIPEIAVEVVSPGDQTSELHKKAQKYLEDGVLLVWLVDPQAKEVTIYKAGETEARILYSLDSVLTANGILPDFALKLADLFAE